MKVTTASLILSIIAVLTYLNLTGAGTSIRTKREELRKLQKKRRRSSPEGKVAEDLNRLIGKLQEEIDGVTHNMKDNVPFPSSNKAEEPTFKLDPVPEVTTHDPSSIRKYIQEWRRRVRAQGRERVTRLLHRVQSLPSCKVLKDLNRHIERISRLESDLAGIYESYGPKIDSALSIGKVRELKEERSRQEGPVIEELNKQRNMFEGNLLSSC